MPASDDENESGESEVYTVVSPEGLEYDSTETLVDLIQQIHDLVHGEKRDLKMLRSLTADLWDLAAINEEASLNSTIGDLDLTDDLPPGWESDAADDDGE